MLRSVVKPGSTGPGGPGGVVGGTRGGVGGRGGSVDRGRGRARGGFHYSRGLSYEDSDGANNTTYSRGGLRPFDRSQVAVGANRKTKMMWTITKIVDYV